MFFILTGTVKIGRKSQRQEHPNKASWKIISNGKNKIKSIDLMHSGWQKQTNKQTNKKKTDGFHLWPFPLNSPIKEIKSLAT